ncbi:MAG: TonB-dependent receptor [Saprospiraceae bacterium]|nr:TonB-dependent receptor [Saprospiraceae bacterium]
MSKLSLFLFGLIFSGSLVAQNAVLYGIVTDGGLGEPLAFATAAIEELSMGATSDLDGKYRLTNIPAGIHTVTFSYLGYESQSIEVTFAAGSEVEQNITLSESGVMMNEVVVRGQATGQRAAINRQINAGTIVNVISQEKLQELPDQNAAEAVGRLAGVSVYRDAGEGQRISIRGISPRFNSITVNGERLPSTEESDRSVDLSMISPDMLAGIELFKSITPDMDGDAIGGSVNFTVAKAEEGYRVQGRLLPGYNQLRDDFGQFRGSISGSNRFFGNKLGVIVTANYQKANRSNESRITDYIFEGSDAAGNPVLSVNSHSLADKLETRTRYGGSLTMDYDITNKHSILLNSSLGVTDRDELRYRRRYRIADNYQEFDIRENQRNILLSSNSLSGKHIFGPVEIEWRSSYALSDQSTPGELTGRFRELAAIKRSIENDQDFNAIQDAFGHNLENTILYDSRFNSTQVNESRLTSQIDLKYPFKLNKSLGGYLKTGIKYIETTRDRDREGIIVSPYLRDQSPASREPQKFIGDASQILLANFIGTYTNDQFYDGQYDILPGTESIRSSLATSLENVDLAAHNALFGTSYQTGEEIAYNGHLDIAKMRRFKDAYLDWYQEDLFINSGDYKGGESITAGYLMAEFNIGKKLDIRGGARYEETDQEYTSFIITGSRDNDNDDTAVKVQSKTDGRKYGELLPMVNLKYKAFEWMDFRLAATKTLSRPNFFNIVPWEYLNPTGRELQYGNPQLLHTTAWNYDAFISFYNKFGLFTVGGFYKELSNIDFIATYVETDNSEGYKGWTVTEPRNIQGLSTVRGVEFDFQTNLTSLNNFLRGVVFGANLTLSSSKTFYPLFSVETVYVGPPTFFETIITDTVRQGNIVGQANVLANINLGYEKGGFSGRISMIHQSDALSPGNPGIGSADSGVGTTVERDFYDQASYRFDVAIKQKVDKKGRWTILLNLNNVTNTPERSFLGIVDRLRDEEFYGMTVDLGLVFKFR